MFGYGSLCLSESAVGRNLLEDRHTRLLSLCITVSLIESWIGTCPQAGSQVGPVIHSVSLCSNFVPIWLVDRINLYHKFLGGLMSFSLFCDSQVNNHHRFLGTVFRPGLWHILKVYPLHQDADFHSFLWPSGQISCLPDTRSCTIAPPTHTLFHPVPSLHMPPELVYFPF